MLKGHNDFATLHPQLLKEWDYDKNLINPSDIPSSYKKNVWWKCSKCGYEWKALIYSRTGRRQSGCKECNKKKK